MNFNAFIPIVFNFDILDTLIWVFIAIDGLYISLAFTSFFKSVIVFCNLFISIFFDPISFLFPVISWFSLFNFSSNSFIFCSFLFLSDLIFILSLSNLSVYSINCSWLNWLRICFFFINLSVNDIFILSISFKALIFSELSLSPSVFSCFSNISFILFRSIFSSFSFSSILLMTLSIKLSYSSLLFAAAILSSVICFFKSFSNFCPSSIFKYRLFISLSFSARSFNNWDISSFFEFISWFKVIFSSKSRSICSSASISWLLLYFS